MQDTDVSESCNATASTPGHEHGENEDEDSDVDIWNEIILRNIQVENDGGFLFEDSEEFGLDGDEPADPWITTDEDEDGYQDLDMYEADCEDQDTDTETDEEKLQIINSSGDEHETSNSKPDKESFEERAPDEDNLRSNMPTLPQVPELNRLPTPEPHHETIALGQHHLWMM